MTSSATKHRTHQGDVVELAIDLPTQGLKAGSRGVVVEAFTEPTPAYDIEFEDENGEFLGIVYSVKPEQITNVSRAILERGFELLNRMDLAGAEREFRRAVSYNPRYPEDITNSILRSEVADDWQAAATLLCLVLRVDPSCQRARDNLSIAYENWAISEARAGNMPKALEILFAALDVRPAADIAERVRQDMSAAHTHLGKSAYETAVKAQSQGDLGLAEESLVQSLGSMRIAHAFWPTDTTTSNVSLACAHLALFYLDTSELRPSLDMFNRMDQTGVIRPEFLNEYGVALGMSGRLEEAINVLERALELLPGDPTIQSNLRNASENMGASLEMIHPNVDFILSVPGEYTSPYAAA